ncbi:MAG: hypothetical protein R3B82_09285 [Sandaracinaceae bacterium]
MPLPLPARVASVALLAITLLGCEPDARNDATIFLDRVQRIDLDDPVAERRRNVESLASLPLSAPEVRRARDACVEAHQTILDAEGITSAARAEVERYEDESQIPITARQRLEADIRRSNGLIERSRSLFDTCHRLTRDLEVRYRSQRAHAVDE